MTAEPSDRGVGTDGLLFPLGHFYSPMYNIADLQKRRSAIWPDPPRVAIDINWRTEDQLRLCKDIFAAQAPLLLRTTPTRDATEYWTGNDQYPPLDAWVLAAMLRHLRPAKMIEVGSGFSSLVTARVNRDELGHQMHFTCIEPYPRDFL